MDRLKITGGYLRRGSQRIGGSAPEWIQIFPYPTYVGELDGERFEWVTDELSQQSCVELFNLRENDLVVDYEHQSDEGGEAPAAGRIVELRAGGVHGLLARVEWTDKARAQIESGEYFYDSPSFWFAMDDRRIYGLRHLALTNNPASWGRPYLTDHTFNDYGIERVSQSACGARLVLVCASAARKGGDKRMNQTLQNVLEGLQSILGRSMTATGNELSEAIDKLKSAVPNTDTRIFLDEQSEASDAAAPTTTIAELLAKLTTAAPESESGQEIDAASAAIEQASQTAKVPATIALALGLKATATPDEAALAIMNLKATTVPLREHEELQQQLRATETATVEERIALAIATQRQKGKKILPYLETELKRVAQSNFALAVATLDNLPSADLVPQSEQSAPSVERRAERAIAVQPSGSSRAVASQTAREETLAIMSANPELTYRQANERRLTEKKRFKAAA